MEQQYLEALRDIRMSGNGRKTRNGITVAKFAYQMRHDLRLGFPLLTTKFVSWKLILAELIWFLEGGKNSPIPYRMSNMRFREILEWAPDRRTIWTHDEMKEAWQQKAKFPGDCGRIYGAQWRNWNGSYDQIANLIHLLRTDPTSRYLKVTAWNPADLGDMCLPPCHGDFQCFVEEVNGEQLLSLHMNQRSCDMFLGVPFNIASYALLTMMMAQVTGLKPGEFVRVVAVFPDVTDAILVKLGLVEPLRQALADRGVEVAIHDGITPDPTHDVLQRGFEALVVAASRRPWRRHRAAPGRWADGSPRAAAGLPA